MEGVWELNHLMASRDGVEVGPHVEGVGEVVPAVGSEEDQGNKFKMFPK